MSKTNELEVKKNTEVALFDESAFDGMEIGNEDIVAAQYKMPLLKIVEPLSKALIEGDALYIPGSAVGDIIDTAVGEVVGKEIEFLPVKAVTLYIEKDSDDKTVAKHEDRSILEKTTWRTEAGKKKGTFLANGNEIQETIYLYGINITSGYEWCAIPFNRGRLPAAQTILQKLRKLKKEDGVTPAPFAYMVWDFKPKATKSNDGKPFRTWDAQPIARITAREDGHILFGEAYGSKDAQTGKYVGGLLNALKDKKTVIEDHEDIVANGNSEDVPF